MAKVEKFGFRQGVKDGFPVGLGYFFVAISFGLAFSGGNYPAWFPVLLSATNLSGTGQFAAANLLNAAGATLIEVAFTVFTVNLRYFLMSVALSQKLSSNVKGWQRFIIACSVTDENFAIEIGKSEVTFPYAAGLLSSSWVGWVSGTAVGALVAELIPDALTAAMGILLYAMFIAIVVPEAKKAKSVAVVSLIAVAVSCLFRFTPILKELSSGWVIIISGIVAAVAGAAFFPLKEEKESDRVVDSNLSGGDGL